jgi:hypothetical protein
MIGQPPPFALATSVFRFRALAQHAGRAALGGDREIALACFAVSRLAAGMLPPFTLAQADVAARAASTKQWIASLALPPAIRSLASAAVDAVAGENRNTTAHAIARLMEAASRQLDQSSIGEMRELIEELSRR